MRRSRDDAVWPRDTTGPGRAPVVTSWDAIVVGAGPGGAITAQSLARRGASVLLLDRKAFPRWKVCGGCLSAGALGALEVAGLGDLVASRGAVSLHHLELSAGARRATIPLRGSAALSRPAFDQGLVEAAISEGVCFRAPARARLGVVTGHGRMVRVATGRGEAEHVGRIVIDATGLGTGLDLPRPTASSHASAPARQSRSPSREVAVRSRVGLGATVEDPDYDLAAGELRMIVGRIGYVGLVRVEDGRLNIAAAVDPTALRGRSPAEAVVEILTEAGRLPPRADVVYGWRGTPALTRGRTDVGAERLFRLGDAAGYVEPFTGEGMCLALHSGLAVSELAMTAVEGWHPDLLNAWSSYHKRSMVRSQRLCRMLAWALRRPRLVRASVGVLGRAPRLAEPFVRKAADRPRSRVGRAA